MDGRTLCCNNKDISLYFATMADKKLVYDMGQDEHEIFDISWEEYQNDANEFYTGIKSRNNYLLVEHNNEIIGTVSYAFHQAKIENMELDIWFRSTNYTGRGFGTQTLVLLMNYLNAEYKIETFMIRPSKENNRAIRAYEKSGFTVLHDFDPNLYYDDVGIVKWGEGDYGVEGTLNMIKIYQ